MKLIIEIPEAKLIALQKGEKMGVGIGELERAVLSGTPTTELESIKQELDTFIEEEIRYTEDRTYASKWEIRACPKKGEPVVDTVYAVDYNSAIGLFLISHPHLRYDDIQYSKSKP